MVSPDSSQICLPSQRQLQLRGCSQLTGAQASVSHRWPPGRAHPWLLGSGTQILLLTPVFRKHSGVFFSSTSRRCESRFLIVFSALRTLPQNKKKKKKKTADDTTRETNVALSVSRGH